MKSQNVPRLFFTPGEPAGIGSDLLIKLVQSNLNVQLIAVADPKLLLERARILGLNLELKNFDPAAPRVPAAPGFVSILPIDLQQSNVKPGQLDPSNSPYVLETLKISCNFCLTGIGDALITGPVHKGIINQAGIAFTGQTEFLAKLCDVETPVMLFVAPGLRVALATTHIPLSQVPNSLNIKYLTKVLSILQSELRKRFRIAEPKILVCGLNPHAGENGYLGHEEITVIRPVVENLKTQAGFQLIGPVPADTAFLPQQLAQVDAVLTMYHDQGLPVVKNLGFNCAVNLTLGLPILRASVDHGTALDLAGTGRVDLGSLKAAINLAIQLI